MCIRDRSYTVLSQYKITNWWNWCEFFLSYRPLPRVNRGVFTETDFIAADIAANEQPVDNSSDDKVVQQREEAGHKHKFARSQDITPVPGPKQVKTNQGRKDTMSTLLTSLPTKHLWFCPFKMLKKRLTNQILTRREFQDLAKNQLQDLARKSAGLPKNKLHYKRNNRIKRRTSMRKRSYISVSLIGLTEMKICQFLMVNIVECSCFWMYIQNDAECILCSEKFTDSKPGELQVEHVSCRDWAHVVCSGGDRHYYVCDFCS